MLRPENFSQPYFYNVAIKLRDFTLGSPNKNMDKDFWTLVFGLLPITKLDCHRNILPHSKVH